jgi:hypothetical protein
MSRKLRELFDGSNRVRQSIESGAYCRDDVRWLLDDMISYHGAIEQHRKTIRAYIPSIDVRMIFDQGFMETENDDNDED